MPPLPVADLGAFLTGAWELERTLWDERLGAGSFRGTATFTPQAQGVLRYHERGTVRLGDHRGPASRRLDYRVSGATGEVTFADGRRFHPLDLRSGRCTVVHPCRADQYHGRFTVVTTDTWEQRWEVTGPDKRQRVHTALRRIADTTAPTGAAG